MVSLGGGAEKDKIPFRERFKAWWEGDAVDLPDQDPSEEYNFDHAVRYEQKEEDWENARLNLIQQVWGEGFSSPGDVDHILEMIKIFALDPAMTVLDLGAGLGGAGRTMCGKFGVWVTGLEANAELAEAGMALSEKAGMTKKSPVKVFDPENFQFKPRSVDCVFSKEFLYTVKSKQDFLEMVEILMKPKGQLLFTDYVLAKRHDIPAEIREWAKHEPQTPHLWAIEDYQETCTELKLDVRITEDITASYQSMVIQAWADFIEATQPGSIDSNAAPALVDEVEVWTRRMQAMDSGYLKVCRMHVFKRDTDKTLSDW